MRSHRNEEEGRVREAASIVREGGVILYPTETVYGLGCDPNAAGAIRRIERLKGRMRGKPMLVLTDDWLRVRNWVAGDIETWTSNLDGLPITFLLPASDAAPRALVGPTGEVGVRCTRNPFCRALIRTADRPVVSTSANRAGQPAPATLDDVDEELVAGVDLAVAGSRDRTGVASTIVRASDHGHELVREGPVSFKQLTKRLGAGAVRGIGPQGDEHAQQPTS